MPSNAFAKFEEKVRELDHLRSISLDSRIRPIGESQKQLFLHSYLTGLVAAWDSYIKSVVREFLQVISNPLDIKYTAVYSLFEEFAESALRKFNTPNSSNSREVLLKTTGYDSIGDWVWGVRGLNGQATRERLNQIMDVRHSFAHGFPMPAFPWNQSSSGKIRLTTQAIDDTKALLIFLATKTDKGLTQKLITLFGITIW